MSGVGWGIARIVMFWAIPVLVVFGASWLVPNADPSVVFGTIAQSFHGDLGLLSQPRFAYALAGTLFFFALGLLLSFALMDILPVVFTLGQARKAVVAAGAEGKTGGERRAWFASDFESLSQRMRGNWLIGHSWSEFEDTLVDRDREGPIGNTVRPQVFFNPAVAREHIAGLKLMNAVPGYFVGVGLLLTFVGLVFALYKAGTAASAGDAKKMAVEMGHLLEIATFKFSTSIAGLSASIILSIFFRWFSILVEGAFDRFNAALERSLTYRAPQSISLEMSRTMADQLVQLKNITQGDFFARMGAEMAPRLQAAVADAMLPVSHQIEQAVGSLANSSQTGMEQLLQSFISSLQHGAGTEMRGVAEMLKQLQVSMTDMQGGLRGTGADFAARLSEAADNLNRMVERAGQTFEQSSGQSRDALAAVVATLRDTLEKANSEVDAALGRAAGGASEKLEVAMGQVLEKLDRQVGQVGDTLGSMQRAMGEQADRTREQIDASVSRSAQAQQQVLADLQGAAQSVSQQLRLAVEEALSAVGHRFGELSLSMRAIEGALTGQKVALEAASGELRQTAQAFGESATSVRAATVPLTSVGATFAGATEKLGHSVGTTLEAILAAKAEIAILSTGLAETTARSSDFWAGFSAKFDDVDTALGKAVGTLSQSTQDQQDRLKRHVVEVDTGLTKAIEALNPLLAEMSESAATIADVLEQAKMSHLVKSGV